LTNKGLLTSESYVSVMKVTRRQKEALVDVVGWIVEGRSWRPGRLVNNSREDHFRRYISVMKIKNVYEKDTWACNTYLYRACADISANLK